jgi:glycosyltransferase involved in cell wall biosynthesis
MHLIGKKLKQALGVTWLADFRDPWTGWFMYREFSISALASRLHQEQEQKVLRAADRVTTVSDILANDLSNIAGRKVETLTNGFDPDDFQDFSKHLSAQSDKFVIKHTGTIDLVRDPRPLLHAITTLCNENKDFAETVEINFIGHLSGVISSEINRSPMAEKITLTPYLPHKQLKQEYASASVLLLLLSTAPETKCVLSGKTFEYLASSTPILAIGPTDGEVARVLKRTGAGVLVDPGNLEGIKKELLILFNRFKQREVNREIQPDISSFSRVSLSEKLADMLNQTLK